METYLSLDIGGSKYQVGVISRDGQIIAKRFGRWETLTAQGVMDTLIGECRALLAQTGETPIAIGATIPGLTDAQRGMWVEASFSGIGDLPICRMLTDALRLPAYCENDGSAYALAEMLFGSCQSVKNFLFVNISNGIGGAVVVDGKLVRGHTGMAGEFGHCCVVPGGRACKCGQQGCLEMYAAGPGVTRNYIALGGDPADAKVIAQRAREGIHPYATQVFEMEGEYLGRVIAMAVNLLNPECVVLGGGVALAFDLFDDSLHTALRSYTYQRANIGVTVRPTPLGYDAGLLSGAAIAISQRERLFGY